MQKVILSFILICFIRDIGFSQNNKVLFVGNSITYYNNMPKIFEKICKEFGIDFEANLSCFSGVGLKTHATTYWYKNRGFNVYDPPNNLILNKKYKVDTSKAIQPTTIKKIIDNNYKVIFLQEQPNYIYNAELRKKYSRPSLEIFDSLAKKMNSELYLAQAYTGKTPNKKCLVMTKCQAGNCDKRYYCSHDFQSFEEMTDTITKIYDNIVSDFECKVIPIATIFEYFRKHQPQIKLYKRGDHPTKQASFIMACTYFYALTNQKDFTNMRYRPFFRHYNTILKEVLNFFNEYDSNYNI